MTETRQIIYLMSHQLFGICVFGHWKLFVIWDLCFVIFGLSASENIELINILNE
jgi:hypothetical protein